MSAVAVSHYNRHRSGPGRPRPDHLIEESAIFEWLADAIRATEASPFAQKTDGHFTLNPPATEEQINQAEAQVGVRFPPDLRVFLLRWNCALSAAHPTPTGDYAVVDCEEDFEPPCWERCVVAPSIEPWLRRVFDEAIATGEPYWWYNLPELREIKRGCMEAARTNPW